MCDDAHPIIDTTVNNDVVVPAGAHCLIQNSTVRGDVTVQNGGSLDIEGSTITGSVTATQSPGRITIGCVNNRIECTRQTVINGNLTVSGATAPDNYICESRVVGATTIKNSQPKANWHIGDSYCAYGGTNNFGGNVLLSNNAARINFDRNQVKGSVTSQDNTGGGEVNNNTISGNLALLRNCPPWTYTGNQVTGTTTDTQCTSTPV